MTDKSVWNEEIPVPEALIQYVDEGVRDSEAPIHTLLDQCPTSWKLLTGGLIAELPPGTQVHGISQSGSSYWARTAKIDATDAAGNPTPFFMKVTDPQAHSPCLV